VDVAVLTAERVRVEVSVKFDEFEALARKEWDDIPPEFKGGVDALVVEREAKVHPHRAEVYTLGECITETWPSDFGGPDTIRSALVLYYGSFRRLADGEPGFDWRAEIWETLTHELRHHLESLAADDHLEDLDAAVEENFRRSDGEAFDPLFFRLGERLGDGWYQLEDAFFLEVDAASCETVEFTWHGVRYRVQLPHIDEDVVFLTIEGGVDDPPSELCLVLLRQRRLRARLRAALKGGWKVAEATAVAERV
jgi:predicted Zn-dependent protease with MMP-like domain